MSDKIPRITAHKAIKVLEKMGFALIRQSGSHKIYRSKDGKRITIPYHSGKILHPKIVKRILEDTDLTVERFMELMR
jgi:predicted RNA binding protein YcfA (HicA-like mRNA interferase family)